MRRTSINDEQKDALKGLVAFALIFISAFVIPALALAVWFEFFVDID